MLSNLNDSWKICWNNKFLIILSYFNGLAISSFKTLRQGKKEERLILSACFTLIETMVLNLVLSIPKVDQYKFDL